MLQGMDHGGLSYAPASYGCGRSLFRGPERHIGAGRVVAIGGTQTFGKFIETPWPNRLEHELGRSVVNLGSVNAGVDLLLHIPELLQKVQKADAVVMEIFGAAHFTNPYFTVHPLRNDRVLAANGDLRRLFPEVDFSEVAFLRHMLGLLEKQDARRFRQLVSALQGIWLQRMEVLLDALDRPVIGLWLADTPPPEQAVTVGTDPLFVTRAMLERLVPRFAGLVHVTPGADARAPEAFGRIYGPLDQCAANTVFPPAIHEQIARALAPVVADCLTERV